MRKIYLFLVVTIFMLYTNCFIDGATSSKLQGQWELVQLNVTQPLDINNDGTSSTNILKEVKTIDVILSFNTKTEGTFIYNSNTTFYTSLVNKALNFLITSSISDEEKPLTFNYTVSKNNTITINTDITFNKTGSNNSVLKIENKNLIMEVENGFVVKDINTDDTTVSENLIYVFAKK